ncbi:MAG: hypothetical protein ACLQRH_25630 [Acidimicrobiales bacterium]
MAASVWVGGQIVMLGLVGPSRRLGPEAPKMLARAFARLAWPAYAVLVVTGLWNVSTFHWSAQSTAWKTVFIVKVVVVAVAGLATLLHSRARSRAALAIWGSVAGLASVAALVMGVLLAG